MTNPPRLTTLRPRVSTVANRLAPGPKVAAPAYQSREWKMLIAGIVRERGLSVAEPWRWRQGVRRTLARWLYMFRWGPNAGSAPMRVAPARWVGPGTEVA
jgi:hypothetical protein